MRKASGVHGWLQHAVWDHHVLGFELTFCREVCRMSVGTVLHAAKCKPPTRNGPGIGE